MINKTQCHTNTNTHALASSSSPRTRGGGADGRDSRLRSAAVGVLLFFATLAIVIAGTAIVVAESRCAWDGPSGTPGRTV